MNLFQMLNVEENPLPLSVLIYLVITGLLIHYKPKMIFDDEESEESDDDMETKIITKIIHIMSEMWKASNALE